MVYCIGLTGNIASGKTTAAELFSTLGVEVIHADEISRELTQHKKYAYKKIVEHYGTLILNKDGELDRSRLREIIFSNQQERIWLEKLLHPLIRKELKKRVKSSISPYCILEIPLLLTKKNYPYINKILLIRASEENLIARVMHRDKCNKEQAQAILTVQPDINLRLKYADDIVINNLGFQDLAIQINSLHHKYLQESMNLN
ncbi:MAG: dephospho-CoA kinase [Legionella longbeachae]|nr:dephospho-CoA kinase [Legionella longbeachae]